MALHALQNVGDAYVVTREFLLPFELRRWLKLAVVAFFIGGGTSFPTAQFGSGGTPDQVPGGSDPELPTVLPDDALLIIAVVAAAVLLVGLAFAIVGAIMEFAFVESLLNGGASVRRYWDRRWGQGLRLFGFRVAIGLPFLAVLLGWLAIIMVPLITGGEPILPVAFLLVGLPVVFLLGLVYGAVSTFTTAFVVPIMIDEDAGVLAGWRTLWPSVRAEWEQYLAFAVVWVGLTIGAGLVSSIAIGIVTIAMLVPLGIVAAIVYVGLGLSTLGVAVLVVLAVVFVLAILVLGALVQVPILSYLRYYALLVLGDVEPAFDLIPDRRRELEA